MKQFLGKFARCRGGIVFTLGLASLYILTIVIIYYGRGLTMQRLLHLDQWTLGGIEEIFFAIVIFGFVFGCCFPQITRRWFAVAILGIPIILFGCILFFYASGVGIPQNIKLADCTNSITTVHFAAPTGRYYRLNFEPIGATSHPLIPASPGPGRIQISQGVNTLTNLPVTGEIVCSFLHAKTNYDLEIIFDQTPPPLTSVWLHWIQSYNDKSR